MLKRTFILLVASVVLNASETSAQTHPGDLSMWERISRQQNILVVAVTPGFPAGKTPYFTADSLRNALPQLWPAHVLAITKWCEKAPIQSGVIVLENKDVIFWRSCEKGLIVFD